MGGGIILHVLVTEKSLNVIAKPFSIYNSPTYNSIIEIYHYVHVLVVSVGGEAIITQMCMCERDCAVFNL